MYVGNGGKSIKGLGQMQGRQTGGGEGLGKIGLNACQPTLILRGFFLIALFAHICYDVQVISIWGGGLAPIKLI